MDLDDTGLQCAAGVAGFGSMPTIELPRPERVEVLQAAIDATAAEESVRPVQVLSVLSGALILKDVVRSRCLAEEAIATEAFSIASTAGLPDADATYAAQIGNIRLMQGAAREIVDVIGQMSRDHTNVPAYRAAYAVCLVSLGQVVEARAVLADDIGNDFADFPMDPVWAVSMYLLAEAVAMMELPEAAETLAARMMPHADVVANGGPTCFGVLHHSLGELLTVLARFDDAEEQFRLAEATHDWMRAPLFLAQTRLSWARMLVRRNGPGDASRAQALVGEARSTLRDISPRATRPLSSPLHGSWP